MGSSCCGMECERAQALADEMECEQAQLAELREEIGSTMALSPQEEAWLSKEILSIYVRARPSLEERTELLKDVLRWRIEKRDLLQRLECPQCLKDPRAHDARMFGVDPEGDIVFSNCFALPHDLTAAAITDHMMCLFERALRDHPIEPGAPPRRWSWVIDLHGFGSSLRHLDPRTSVKLLPLLQTAYRARLKRLLIVDAPMAFWALWKVVTPVIKPATAKLIEFIDFQTSPPRYMELFGAEVALELVREASENRDSAFREKKVWNTFYGRKSTHSAPQECTVCQ